MPYTRKFYYPESNPFTVGDTVFWKGNAYTVGDDGQELERWGSSGEHHIVTTCGRVLDIDDLDSNKTSQPSNLD